MNKVFIIIIPPDGQAWDVNTSPLEQPYKLFGDAIPTCYTTLAGAMRVADLTAYKCGLSPEKSQKYERHWHGEGVYLEYKIDGKPSQYFIVDVTMGQVTK